ncbi:MAG: PEP-CTERM sorting domain-containing protein [Acidobacteriaceae bacterium]|nr:PEP-CTERM sorting domain-containing protein [Acidobacteriaceae bacterium]
MEGSHERAHKQNLGFLFRAFLFGLIIFVPGGILRASSQGESVTRNTIETPEPATLALVGGAMVWFGALQRRRRKKN